MWRPCPSVRVWPSISIGRVCLICTKFGMRVCCDVSSTRQRREKCVSDSYTLLKDVNEFEPMISISLHRFERNSTSKIFLVASSVCEFGNNFCTARFTSQTRKLISVIFSILLILYVSNSVDRMSTKIFCSLAKNGTVKATSQLWFSICIFHTY